MFKHIVMKSSEIKGTFPDMTSSVPTETAPFRKKQTGAMMFGSQAMLFL